MSKLGQFFSRITRRVNCGSCGQSILLLDENEARKVGPQRYLAEIESDLDRVGKTGLACKVCQKVICVWCSARAGAARGKEGEGYCPLCNQSLKSAHRVTTLQVGEGTVFE
jgi:hypothetical protein